MKKLGNILLLSLFSWAVAAVPPQNNFEESEIIFDISLKAKALLAKGSVLHRLQDGKKVTLPKDTYVNTLKSDLDNQWVYVLNKKNQPSYAIPYGQVTFIDQTTDLLQPPTLFEEYIPQKPIRKDSIAFAQELSFFFYQGTSKFIKNIKPDASDLARGGGALYQAYTTLDFPLIPERTIVLGGQFNYSLGTISSPNQRLKVQQFSLGPIIKVPIATFNQKKVFLQLAALSSLSFQVEDPENNRYFPFRSQSLSLGLQTSYHSRTFANIMFGTHFSREWITPQLDQFPQGHSGAVTGENKLSLIVGIKW